MSRSFMRTVRSWTHSLRAPLNRPTTNRRASVRLRFQDLEDRTTPSQFLVKNTNDSGADSLRQAILNANAAPGADEIVFDTSGVFATPQTITAASTLSITGDVTITGTGVGNLTVSGGGAVRVFDSTAANLTLTNFRVTGGLAANATGGGLLAGGIVTIDHMLFNANAATGTAFVVQGGGGAIAMRNGGFLKVSNSTISGNTAGRSGGGIMNYFGGLVLENSTITGNTATFTGTYLGYSGGGGLAFLGTPSSSAPAGFTAGTAVIRNCTFVGNSSTGSGGAMIGFNVFDSPGVFLVQDSTITGNNADSSGLSAYGYPYGGGGLSIMFGGNIVVQNSVISGNTNATSPDIQSRYSVNTSFSLIGDINGFTEGNGGGNLASGTNPMLGSLADNGGPTFTMLPQAGSPLLNAGSNAAIPSGLFFDQRGFGYRRVFNTTVDIGAVEVQPLGLPLALATTTDVAAANDGQTSYTFTVLYADPTGINRGIKVNGIINHDDVVRVTGPNGFNQLATYVSIDNATDGTPRTATYRITPPGGSWNNLDDGTYTVSIEANKVFDNDGNAIDAGPIGAFNVIILPILVTNANDSGSGSLRDAIALANLSPTDDEIDFDSTFFSSPHTINLVSPLPTIVNGDLLILNSTGAANATVMGDGNFGIFDVGGSSPNVTVDGLTISGGGNALGGGFTITAVNNLNVVNSVISGNTGLRGGAVYIPAGHSGLVKIQSSTITGNSGPTGGIYFYANGSLLVQNSTLSNNTGTLDNIFNGGAIVMYGGIGSGGFTIEDSTIDGNSTANAAAGGGGINFINVTGAATIRNSTITGNTAPDAAVGGGGVGVYYNNLTLTIENTIIAGNTGPADGPDLRVSGGLTSAIATNSLIGVAPPANFIDGGGNQMGASGTPLDPKLGALQDNGGPTFTKAPLTGSPVIDAGSDDLIPPGMTTDQRGPGFFRSFADAVDIGAVEDQPITTGPFVTADTTNIYGAGGTDYFFTVTYSDPNGTNNGIDVSSVIDNDNAVRVTGPNGFSQLATYVSIDNGTNGTPRTVTYRITAPGGDWDGADTGHYRVQMQSGQVKDLDGNFAPQVNIGRFVAVISPLVVTNADDSGPGSLRDAVTLANLSPNDDEIVFDPVFFGTQQEIKLQSPLPQFAGAGGGLTITGPGASLLTVERDANAASDFRVLDSMSPALNLSGFTVSGGTAFGGGLAAWTGGALDHMVFTGNNSTGFGGAIYVGFLQSLTVLDSTISGNSANGPGGGIVVDSGGSLTVNNTTIGNNTATTNGGGVYFYSGGSLLLANSTLSGNQTTFTGTYDGYRGGGGLYFFGFANSLVISNSTVANNTSAGTGGGIMLQVFFGNISIENSTISGNTAQKTGASYYGYPYGGGGIGLTVGNGSISLANSIVSGNTNAGGNPDISSLYSVYAYYSAIGDTTGFNYNPNGSNLIGQALLLGPLQSNGGPTQTIAPQTGSPLIDAGSNALVSPGVTTDQRGGDRIYNGTVDIGSVEFQPPRVTINQALGQADPTNTGPIKFDVQFTTLVTGFDASDISFAGSTVGGTLSAAVTQTGPSAYQVSVTGMSGQGTVVVSIPANAATDPNTGLLNLASTSTDNTVTFDDVVPTVTINQAVGQSDPTNTAPVDFDVVFSEPVVGFTSADINFTGSTIAGLTASIFQTGPNTYTVSVTPPGPASGKVVVSIPAGAVTDPAGNSNTASTSTDNSVDLDNVPPTVTINQHGTSDPVGGTSVQFDVLFSEPVVGFTDSDIDLTGTTAPGATAAISGSGPAYTVTVSGMTAGGLIVASIPGGAVTDLAGNPNDPSTSTDNTITYVHSGSVQFSSATYTETEHNGPVVTITVTRTVASGIAEGPLSVNYSTGGGTAIAGSDYVGATGTLSWLPGETGPKTFTIQILDDTLVEGDETVGIALSNISLAGALGTPSSATLTITDFEEGKFSFSAANYSKAEGQTASIVINRTNGSDGTATVDYSMTLGTAEATDIGAPSIPVGTITFAPGELSKTIDVPIVNDTINEGYETVNFALSSPTGGATLGSPASAMLRIDPSDGIPLNTANRFTTKITDTDQDTVTVMVTGNGKVPTASANVFLTDGTGPISLVELSGTDPLKTALMIKVAKAKATVNPAADGLSSIGGVVAPALKSLNASKVDLIGDGSDLPGDGIQINGFLGGVTVHSVQGGADIKSTGAPPRLKTRLTLGVVEDGTTVDVATPISSLSAVSFGDGAIIAPYAGSISTRGRPANAKKNDPGDPGNFLADVTLNGTGVLAGKSALASLRVKGNIIDSDISVNGKVGSVSANAFIDSRLFVGFVGTDSGVGTFNPAGTLNSFTTKAATDSFQNSHVIANQVRTASLASIKTDNTPNGKFGILSHTPIGLVKSKSPAFTYTTKTNGSSKTIGDFEIRANVLGTLPPLAHQSAVAVHEVGPNRYMSALTPEPIVVAGPPTTITTSTVNPLPRIVSAPSPTAVTTSTVNPLPRIVSAPSPTSLVRSANPSILAHAPKGIGMKGVQGTAPFAWAKRIFPQRLAPAMTALPTSLMPADKTGMLGGLVNRPVPTTGPNGNATAALPATPPADVSPSTPTVEVTPIPVVTTTAKPQVSSSPTVVKTTAPPAPLVSALPATLGRAPVGSLAVNLGTSIRGVALSSRNTASSFRVTSNFLGQQVNAGGADGKVSAAPFHLPGSQSSSSDGIELA